MSPRRAAARRSAPHDDGLPAWTALRVPAQRGPRDPQPRPRISGPNDDALLVLHGAAEDPGFQQFLDELPLVEVVAQLLEWAGDG